MTVKAAVTVVGEWEILCSWIHMMYTDCRQDYTQSVPTERNNDSFSSKHL